MDRLCEIRAGSGQLEGLWKHNLRNKEFCTVLEKTYYEFLICNYGPAGGFTLIRNSAGNEALTSSSKVLLQQLQFFHPAFKFINALINAQLKAYEVHSLYVGIVCSGLLFRALKLEEIVSYRIIINICDWIQDQFLNDLFSEQKSIHFTLNTGNIDHILCMVTGLINSKTSCILTQDEKMHLAIKIVEAFLKTIPESEQNDFGFVNLSTIEGPSTLKTQLIEGILHRESEYTVDDLQLHLNKLPKENLRVILFNVALSHNTENKTFTDQTSIKAIEINYNDHISELLLTYLRSKGIHILANQKYIHPSIKYNLEKEGYIVIERLGTSLTDSLIKMAGCIPISTLPHIQSFETENYVGIIPCLKAIDIEGKAFLHMQPKKHYQNITLILTGINCHVVEYLQDCVNSSIRILQQMISDSSAVVGGGCFEAYGAFLLSQMAHKWTHHLADMYDASPAKIPLVFGIFIDTFLHLSIRPTGGTYKRLSDYVLDSSFYHLWMLKEVTEGETTHKWNTGRITDECNESSKLSDDNFAYVNAKCACKLLDKSNLPQNCKFIPLLNFKVSVSNLSSYNSTVGPEFSEAELETNSDNEVSLALKDVFRSSIKFNKESIFDYLPAKANALRFAFDGFAELFRIGECIFDK